MSLISTEKKYRKLITAGCSFSTGFYSGEEGSWGYALAQRLGCEHINLGGVGNSNYNIMVNLVNYCESNDLQDCCVGVQLTNYDRREFWRSDIDCYFSFGAAVLTAQDLTDRPKHFSTIMDNFEFFDGIWFNRKENLIRNVHFIILITSYLKSKGIDFIMFEGIGSLLDVYLDPYTASPFSQDVLLSKPFIESLLKDTHFFSLHGDMQTCMDQSSLFDPVKNQGHPNLEFVDWWCDEMYFYLKDI